MVYTLFDVGALPKPRATGYLGENWLVPSF